MKLSLALGPRRPLSRQMALGCLTTNFAVPGFGSLLAGRVIGYFQIAVYLAGFGLTMVFGVQGLIWCLHNYSRLQQETDVPFESLIEMWQHLKLALLGVALFLISTFWAWITSLSIVAQARADERKALLLRPLPPKIR